MSTPMPAMNPVQPTVLFTMPAPGTKTEEQKHKSKLRGLAVAEVVLGVACIILGAIVSGIIGEELSYFRSYRYNNRYPSSIHRYNSYDYVYDSYYYYRYYDLFTTGEGIWCGVWIIIAGATGIHAAKAKSSRCMINTHLGFSIVSCIICGVMVIICGIAARRNEFLTAALVLNSLLATIGFVCFVLHIISASYCCAAVGCCAAGQPYVYGGQVAYTQPAAASIVGTNPIIYTQQPTIQYQGVPNVQQGYVLQGQQQQMVQTTFPGTVVYAPPSTVQPNQALIGTAASSAQNQEKGFDLGVGNVPPSYNASTQ